MNTEVQFASGWKRFCASIIDGIIWGIPLFVLSFMMGEALGDDHTTIFEYLFGFAVLVAILAYDGFFQLSNWQATPGMRVMKIYLVSATAYARCDQSTILKRLAVYYGPSGLLALLDIQALSSLESLYYLVLGLAIVFTKEKTGLHDMVAGTRVIYGRPVGSEKLRFS